MMGKFHCCKQKCVQNRKQVHSSRFYSLEKEVEEREKKYKKSDMFFFIVCIEKKVAIYVFSLYSQFSEEKKENDLE